MTLTAPAVSRLAVALAITLGAPLAAARGIPPGFEDLAEGQTEQLDVRLFGYSSGLTPVRVTLEQVQIEAPADVLRALGLPAEAQAALLPALSQPLPRNSHLACRHGSAAAGCGYLPPPQDPATVLALYDEGEGAVHLFVEPRWLPVPAARTRHHLPSADAENAFLHRQMINVSGSRGQQVLTAQGAGILGMYRQAHLAVEWNLSRWDGGSRGAGGGLQVDNAYYRHDLGRQHYLQAGRMDRRNLASPQGGTFAFGMLPMDRFQGLRVGTTQAYVDADAAIDATPLTVLLSRNARVDAFDGERLLQSWYLQAGVNQLDTSRFPFGNYLVTLRIHEDGVLVRTESAPFEKGGDWGDDSLEWFAQGGQRSERRRTGSGEGGAVMAGMRAPLSRGVATTLGAASLSGARFGELRVDLRRSLASQELRVSTAYLRGSDGSHGQQHQLSVRRRVSWSLYHQRLRGAGCDAPAVAQGGLACADALSASVATPFAGGSIYLGHTRRQAWRSAWREPTDGVGDADVPWNFLLPSRIPSWPSWQGRQAQTSRAWQASYSRTQRWQQASVALRLGLWREQAVSSGQARPDLGVYLNLSLSQLLRNQRGSPQRRYGMDIRQPRQGRTDASYSAGYSLREERDGSSREASAEIRGDSHDRYSALLGGQWQNGWGQTGVLAVQHRRPGHRELTYSGSHSSMFAVARRGLYWGGGMNADAALAVEVDAIEDVEPRGVAAELQVAGLRRQRLRLGERRLLPLPAYQPHRASLQDASAEDGLASIRIAAVGGSRSLFLPPGRLLRLPVPVEASHTFVGTARDAVGTPISGARILNAAVPATGALGGFVVETPQRDEALYLLQDARLLRCPLRVHERRSALLLVGAVQCTAIDASGLPASILGQARTTRLLREASLVPLATQAAMGGHR
ncbi:TcfC E-set like domain-containing protein [Stenotrophomonas tumulicola]|uniref:TcfC E-set like domain-containing protein n=1 Tax=Stenotrophomonas tumulicola TaxID=1685415 RepID=A0A7W3FQN9_9GAMM|nr:TcfC E-set like domain-containing protein [Stenotrophomonas tumulicola]MBA8683865.1 TcfC E-set like domain-containing protein [Stenotrophomonas tumulicola]